ncbi:MAG: TetR/AcrR family transcriptional regulator [Chloroflexi bacterium]|nr:TetR/AcrR family transcriptional regulator [Chloroflexota bacterium]
MTAKYHHGDLRNALIEVGEKVLREEGVEAFTLRRLTKEVGVSHNAPYRHFKNRDDLLAAVSERGYWRLRDHVEEGIERHEGHIQEQLMHFSFDYIDFALKNRHLYPVMFSSNPHLDSEALIEVMQNALTAFVEIFERGQAAGTLRTDSPLLQALTLFSLLHGVANVMLAGRFSMPFDGSQPDVETLVRGLVEVYMGGILATNS